MIQDNSLKSFNYNKFFNYVSFNEEERRLLKKYHKCKTRKCSKINKEQIKEEINYVKELEKKCPQKSSNAFYNCGIDFYNKSKFKKLFDKYVKCGTRKCSKEEKALRKEKKAIRKAIAFNIRDAKYGKIK